MTVFDFNDRGQAHVSEQEFMDYLAKTARRDDYTKRVFSECQVTDRYWVMCECINYYNGGGCLLARYNLDFNYGELI